MSQQQNSTFKCPNPLNFNDAETQTRYAKWMHKTKLLQIRYINALTAILYIIATIVDNLIAPEALKALMTTVHLYLLPPLLFFIAFLSFKPKLSQVMITLLILAPIIAIAGNLLIVSHLDAKALRLTEVYLILFWVFTVSGLRVRQAIISGGVGYILIFVVSTFYFTMDTEAYVMHCFWMTASFSFGLLSAFLLEQSNKSVFINEEKLKQLAITDKLTGLYNRTKLDEVLHEELARTKRNQNSFGLILLDFDYFKDINDTYGHHIGDEVLKEIAQLLTEHLRTSDKAVRWGGEEFILIYVDTEKNEVISLAEDLRQKIANHNFNTVGMKTASFGVTIAQESDTIDTIIKRADKALYQAKGNGRNRIEFL